MTAVVSAVWDAPIGFLTISARGFDDLTPLLPLLGCTEAPSDPLKGSMELLKQRVLALLPPGHSRAIRYEYTVRTETRGL